MAFVGQEPTRVTSSRWVSIDTLLSVLQELRAASCGKISEDLPGWMDTGELFSNSTAGAYLQVS